MNVKQKVVGVAALFFLGLSVDAQRVRRDTAQKTEDIEEVVVMGYVKRKVSNTTGSSTQIGAQNIENPTQSNAEFALQGQVAGVQAVASSGTPGAQQDIRIRGVGSFSASNRPLYVIDGVPVNDVNMGLNNSDGTTDYSTLSPLAAIPSTDIESITVLKDASATAAYGARGSNGVIVVTTKRGSSGKARFTLSSNLGFQNDAFNKMQMLNAEQRFGLMQEAVRNQYALSPEAAIARISANNFGNYNGWNNVGRPNGDWFNAVRRRNAMTQEHNLSASGGSQAVKYYMSLNYNDTEATVIGTSFQRTSANIKMDATLNPKTKIQSSVLFSSIKQDPILEQGSFFDNPFLTRYLMTPWYATRDAAGNPNIDNISRYASVYNTLYTNAHNTRHNQMFRTFATFRVDYQLTKGLTLANNFSLDYMIRDFKNFQNRTHGGGAAAGGTTYRQMLNNVNFVNQLSLNYVKRLGDNHRFDALALFEYQKNQQDVLSGGGESFPIDGLTNLDNAGKNFTAGSNFLDFQNSALLGMLNYSFANRLVLDGTFRYEGSSKFAPGLRYGSFWSVGGAYNLHRDIFTDVFNELKLRASYGTSGNAGIDYNQYQDLLSYNINYGGGLASYPANYANNQMTWEKNKTLDFGLDFSFWNRRVSGSVGYFNKATHDLLQYVPLSRTTGFNRVLMNVGDMKNTGIETSLSVDVIRSAKFNLNLYGNFSTLRNEITRLAKDSFGNDVVLFPGSTTRGAEVGTPYNYWRMRTWAGVNAQTGAPEWYVNGVDGERTSSWNNAAAVDHGVSMPKFQGGFGAKVDMGPIFVNAMFSFQGGHKIYENYAQFYNRTNNFTIGTYNGSAELLNRWQASGDVTDVPKLTWNQNDNFHNASSRWLKDGDFIRLRNLQVGYRLKSEYLDQMGINGLTIQLTGTNLWTWVKDKSLKLDPETRADGLLMLTTPPVKTVMAGVTLNF